MGSTHLETVIGLILLLIISSNTRLWPVLVGSTAMFRLLSKNQ